MFSLSLLNYINENEKKHNSLAHLVGAAFEKTCLEIIKKEYKDFTFYLYPDLDMDFKILFNLPQYDLGIDIIGLDEEKKIALLIQCKYTKDIDKTFSYGNDKLSHLSAQENRFTKSIAVKEQNWKSKIIVMTTGKRVKNCEDDLIVLNGEFLDGKLGFIDLDPNKDAKITEEKVDLREYQKEIVEKLREFYDFENRSFATSNLEKIGKTGKLIMATGTGKTLTFSYYLNNIIEFLDRIPKKIVIVAPTLALVEQIRIVLYNYLNCLQTPENNRTVIKICSDGTSDQNIILNDDKNIYLTTYDSFYLFEKMENLFVILDESHHAVNPNIQEILDSLIRSDQLYLTATEKIYDSLLFDNGVSSVSSDQKNWKQIMKDMPLIAKYNIGQGIKDGYLSDYNIEIISFVGDKDKHLSKIIIDKILSEEAKKIVIYCSRIEKIKNFCKYLGKILRKLKLEDHHPSLVNKKLTVLTVSGENTLREKSEIFKKFSEYDIGILLNVSILSEGIDIPCIDTVFFYDNRNSRIELIQNIGRALRIHPGKKFSTVCINLDLNEVDLDFEESEDSDSETESTKNLELLRKKCKNIYKTLMYLSNEDSTFLDYYKKYGIKTDFIKNKKIKFIGELDLDLTDRIISETYTRFLDRTIGNWDKKYSEVREFIGLNNRSPSSISKNPEERSLYEWLGNQRVLFRSGKLDDYKIQKLRNLDFWNLYSEKREIPKSFDERLMELRNFFEENKVLPSRHSKKDVEKSLAKWISRQRTNYKKDKLDKDKIEKLESLEFWSWDPLEDNWNQNYQNLVKFIKESEALPSHHSKKDAEKSLRGWIKNQRRNYKKNGLDKDKIEKLEGLGFWSWDPLEDNWTQNYQNLTDFIRENKTLPNKRGKEEREKSLGLWTGFQRTNYKKDKLDRDKIEKLEKLPELYLDYDRFDTIYRFIKGYGNMMQYWKENQKFPKGIHISESYFYHHIKESKNLKKYQKYLANDIYCIENKKLPTDLTLISKYLLSLTKKVKLEDYYDTIKKLAQQTINTINNDKDLWKKKESLELIYLDQEEKLLDENGKELKLETEQRLDIYYVLLKNLDKVLKLISPYPDLVKLFAFYHAKAYPDIMIDYIRDLFIKNDLRCFIIDLDRVWE